MQNGDPSFSVDNPELSKAPFNPGGGQNIAFRASSTNRISPFLISDPRWGTADGEIKDLSVVNSELKGSPFGTTDGRDFRNSTPITNQAVQR